MPLYWQLVAVDWPAYTLTVSDTATVTEMYRMAARFVTSIASAALGSAQGAVLSRAAHHLLDHVLHLDGRLQQLLPTTISSCSHPQHTVVQRLAFWDQSQVCAPRHGQSSRPAGWMWSRPMSAVVGYEAVVSLASLRRHRSGLVWEASNEDKRGTATEAATYLDSEEPSPNASSLGINMQGERATMSA